MVIRIDTSCILVTLGNVCERLGGLGSEGSAVAALCVGSGCIGTPTGVIWSSEVVASSGGLAFLDLLAHAERAMAASNGMHL